MQSSNGPIGNLDPKLPIRIYGAGISGLLIAHFLNKKNIDFEVYEKESRAGGKIQTTKGCFGQAEQAANAVFTNDDVLELCKDLKVSYIEANSDLKKKIFRAVNNFKIISPFEIIRVIFCLFKKTPKLTTDMSVKDFFKPLLGEKLCNELLSSALSGVYATPCENLHFQSLFKTHPIKRTLYIKWIIQLIKARKEASKTKATSISFDNGMKDFIDSISSQFKNKIHYNSSPKLDNHYNNIICTDAHEAAELIEESFPELAKELMQVSYLKVTSTTYIQKQNIPELEQSFGVLIPPTHNMQTMGILNNSAIFNRGKKEGNFSYTFISQDIQTPKESNARECLKIFDYKLSDHNLEIFSKVWPKGIPLYDYKRWKSISQLRSLIYNYSNGLIINGNYVDGISIREMTSHAKEFVNAKFK